MSHTYASLADFKRFQTFGGSATYTSDDETVQRLALEAASRKIDRFVQRSPRGRSGFGPRTGTNYYDGDGGTCLWLDDDLYAVTSVTVLDETGSSSSTSLVETTDYYLEPYDGPPYRILRLNGLTSAALTAGLRTIAVVGTWGYHSETVAATTLGAAISSTTATTITAASGSAVSVGQTALIDSEQLYVTGISSNTLTVVRGANGTTAATHSNGAALSAFHYPEPVTLTCCRLAFRSLKAAQAGLTDAYGGDGVPIVANSEGELSILWRGVGDYRLSEPT